jgi:glycosyltransferase involved in cell wall biosynthesis/2-polyprenyl-3-methyl-5-hydroxy-6-metoxy-1,4-benzoquinol methylase
MTTYKLDLVFLVAGMEIYPNIMEEKSLGGSETVGLEMAYGMARRGHNVKLFCNTPKDVRHNDVSFHPISRTGEGIDQFNAYVTQTTPDVAIVQRIPEAFNLQNKCKMNVLWQHDFATIRQRSAFNSSLWNVDEVFVLSDWQKKQYSEVYGIEDNDVPSNSPIMWQTSNGIQPIKDYKLKRKPKQLVFTNRPERGLDILLYDIAPLIWKRDKEVEIIVCGYDNTTDEMANFYQSLALQIKQYQQEGFKIKHVGSLTKDNLYKLYQESTAFVYPTLFYETSCITAMETQECGLPMITTKRGALPETCGDGNILIEGEARDSDYQASFVDGVFEILGEHGTPQQAERIKKLKAKSSEYYWDKVCEKWETHFNQFLRSKTKCKRNLYAHLYQREDIMALKHALTSDNTELGEEYKEKINKHYSYIEDRKQYVDKYIKLGEEYIEKETNFEPRAYPRTQLMIQQLQIYHQEKPIKEVLDFGSGIGNEAFYICQAIPNVKVDCVNISEKENEGAVKLIKNSKPELLDNIKFITADEDTIQTTKKYDALFLGEILEHQPDPAAFLSKLEKHLKHEAPVIISVPHGLWEDERHAHLWNFERRDLQELLVKKKNISVQTVSGASNVKLSDNLGWWVVSYQKTPAEFGKINLDRKVTIQSPRELISTCMIVKNEEAMLGRALASVADISDEIIIADNGSTDRTLEIARQYGATILKGQNPQEIGFDEARNLTISKAKNSWILWLDADEELQDNYKIIKYLRHNSMNGYSLKQVHFSTDPPVEPKIDLPIRLFRNHKGVRFFGFVHEHPELEIGAGVGTSMILSDITIAHDGYLTEPIRRQRFYRNIPLMFKDREKYPDRLLGHFLMLRDYVHLARYEVEQNKRLTGKAIEYCNQGMELFKKHFSNDDNMYQEEALSFYTEAMKMVNIGHEFANSLIWVDKLGKEHNIDVRGRFLNSDEYLKYLESRLKAVEKNFTGEFL